MTEKRLSVEGRAQHPSQAGDENPADLRYADALVDTVNRWGARSSPPDRATVLKQYELIRAEVTTSLQIQQQILSFGMATIGLLTGAAFVGDEARLRSTLLVVFLPLVAYLAVTVWFSEVMRMLRAGAFLLTLEKKLDVLGDGSLEWEYTVARGRLRYPVWKPYFGVLDPDQLRLLALTLLFLVIAAASVFVGWSQASNYERSFAVLAGGTAATVLFLLFQLRIDQLEELLGVDPSVRSLRRLRRLVPLPPVRRRHDDAKHLHANKSGEVLD